MWDPNTTIAYLYQSTDYDSKITMVWERADILDMQDEVELGKVRFIGTVNYNTERKIIVE